MIIKAKEISCDQTVFNTENTNIQHYNCTAEATTLTLYPTNQLFLDLSELSFDERFRFVNAFSAELYNWHKAWGYKHAP